MKYQFVSGILPLSSINIKKSAYCTVKKIKFLIKEFFQNMWPNPQETH